MNYKILKPGDLTEPKVYFTDCDLVAQSLFKITRSELIDKLKVLSLLNNKVVIATSHILESNLSFKTLTGEALLLQEGVLVPALRASFEEFGEYVKKRRKRLRRFVIGQKPRSSRLLKRADRLLDAKSDFLTENTKEVVTWEVASTAKEFKTAFVKDLTNPISLLNQLIDLPEKTLNRLVSRIISIDKLSRIDIEMIFTSLPAKKKLLVLHNANLNYFLAGSNAVKSDLVTHYNSIDFLKDKTTRSFVLKKHHQQNYHGTEVFETFMDALEIPRDSIRRLTDQQILELRKDSATKRFRDKYNKTLSLVRKGSVLEAKEFAETEYAPVKKEIKQAIENEIEEEVERDRIVYQVKKGFRKASYISAILTVTGFVFPIPIPQTATLPIALYKVVDPFISKLWNSIGNVEFLVFAAKIGEPRRIPWR